MRTTLTLEPDIVARLEPLKAKSDSFKELVNTVLRRGLDALESEAGSETKKPFRTKIWSAGKALIDLDDIAEVLAYIEGEDFK